MAGARQRVAYCFCGDGPLRVKGQGATPATAGLHCGDYAKLLVVMLCLVFLACVVLHSVGRAQFFSTSYLNDGFCISNRSQPFWTSHAISFYADAATAFCMMGLVREGRRRGLSEAATTPMSKNSMSLLGHGVGHLFLATRAGGSGAGIFEDLSPVARLAVYLAFMPVWYGFMMDKRRSVVATVGFMMFHNTLQVFFLPTSLFFTHVLMAVLLNSAFRWLVRPKADKTRYYAMEAWLVDVPILLASFGEALACDAFLMSWGGHVWFDMVVPVGFTVYYIMLVNDASEIQASGTSARAVSTDSYISKPTRQD